MKKLKRSSDQQPLRDQVAIVTGAAQGMGASVALRLAEAGAEVVICDIALEKAKETSQRINAELEHEFTTARGMDVTKEEQVSALVSETLGRCSRISILVNNAGILFPTPISEISLSEWESVMEVNLTGSFLCSKAVVPAMRSEGYGRIINMSSSAGRSVSTLGGAHYTAAKAGVLGLTRALAKELSSAGILVNAICPGLIDTEMVHKTCGPDRIAQYERSFPVNRLGQPHEVADCVLFLCATGSYITGASIDVNGGDLMM